MYCLTIKSVNGQSCNSHGIIHYTYADIKHILDRNQCNSCHNKNTLVSSWHYEDYVSMTGISNCRTPVVIPGDITGSLLVDKINGGWVSCGTSMPPGNKSVSPEDLLAIENWVQSGAPEFCISTYHEIRSMPELQSCRNCHNQPGLWNSDSYTSLFLKHTGADCLNEKVLVPGNAVKSLLFTKLNSATLSCGQLMPLENTALSYEAISRIRDWINAGAPEFAKPLPVTLEELFLHYKDEKMVALYWRTGAELNTRTFEIQHSTDGIQFHPMGNISAKGQSNKGANYSFDHDTPRVGYNYYRLKIIDFDDVFTYSPIRVVYIKNKSEIYTIYPNPVTSGSSLIMEWLPLDEREKVKISVMDITGKIAFEQIIHSGINTINLPELRNGVYYITVKDYNESYRVQRLVITGL